jgi:hypothetical protein
MDAKRTEGGKRARKKDVRQSGTAAAAACPVSPLQLTSFACVSSVTVKQNHSSAQEVLHFLYNFCSKHFGYINFFDLRKTYI